MRPFLILWTLSEIKVNEANSEVEVNFRIPINFLISWHSTVAESSRDIWHVKDE